MANFKSNISHFFLLITLLSSMVGSHSSTGSKNDLQTVKKRFMSWLQFHNKHYKDKKEWMLRFGIYHSNLNFIDLINSQNLTYKLGDNEFADLTNEEFRSLYVGQNTNSTESINKRAPKQIDWRKKGAVNAIKNQGQCGSCWAFSAISAVESMNKIKHGKLVTLSEQELVDCDTKKNLGCRGGFMEEAFKYIKKSKGISSEQNYPYTGKGGSCHAPKKKAVRISGHKTVKPNSEKSLKAAVAKQPVSVGLESSGILFQLYSHGIFNGLCGTSLDHAVTVVGYGEEDGGKYWIIRNSWGTAWGEDGYMRLTRDSIRPQGACGIAMMPSYPLAAVLLRFGRSGQFFKSGGEDVSPTDDGHRQIRPTL
ncbi:hypothetical protein V2J09_020897 [Rumex salicifolius]